MMSNEPVQSVVVGMLEVNCYLVQPPESKTLYIIDPGGDPKLIERQVRSFSYRRAVILLTHAHVDHIGAVGAIAKTFGVEDIYMHPDDAAVAASPENAILPYLPAVTDLPAMKWPLKEPGIEVFHTPGHSPGGVCYYFKDLKILFCGDTLFRCSVGRTDLPGGSTMKLLNSIREKLMILPDDVVVYPGHGDASSIGYERRYNPYLAADSDR